MQRYQVAGNTVLPPAAIGAALTNAVLGVRPIANPLEMGSSHTSMIATLSKIQGYRPYFKEAFGSEEIIKERVAHAIHEMSELRTVTLTS